jgi:hypothetical protein
MSKRRQYGDDGSILASPKTMEIVDISSTDHAFAVTTRALSWGVDGDIVAVFADGTTKTIATGSLAVGVQHAMQLTQITKVGTTATSIKGWY